MMSLKFSSFHGALETVDKALLIIEAVTRSKRQFPRNNVPIIPVEFEEGNTPADSVLGSVKNTSL